MNPNSNIHYTPLANDCFIELYSLTRPLFKQGVQSIYDTVCEKSSDDNNMLFREFQEELQKVPSWNSVMIEKEYERFVLSSGCEWLGKLIVANFKAAAKNVLSSIQSSEKQENSIDLEVPTPQNFMHYCYIEIARQVWKKPQLFYHKFSAFTKQHNDESIDKMIENSIKTTINKQLPFDTLLKQSEDSNETCVTPPLTIGSDNAHDQYTDDSSQKKGNSTVMAMPPVPLESVEKLESVSDLYLPTKPINPSPITTSTIATTSNKHSSSLNIEPLVKHVVNNNLEKQPSTESFIYFDSNNNNNLNQVRTPSPTLSSTTSIHKSASFVAPRRDSMNESDDEEEDESVSNISNDYCSDDDDSFQNNSLETPTPAVHTTTSPLSVVPSQQPHQEEAPYETSIHQPESQPLQRKEAAEEADFIEEFQQKLITQEVTNPTILTNHEEEGDVVIPVENNTNNDNEQFHIDLNKSIKEIYINDKKRKNEKKIKKILGVKMNYDTYIQQDKRKLRNYLILNQQSIPKA